jgi:hypothetical protein
MVNLLEEHRYDRPLEACGVRLHGGFVRGHYHPPRSLNREKSVRSWIWAYLSHYRAVSDVPREIIENSWPVYDNSQLDDLRAVISVRLLCMQRGERSGRHIGSIDASPAQVLNPPRDSALAALPALLKAHALDEAGHTGNEGHVLFVKVLLDQLWDDRANNLFGLYWHNVGFARTRAPNIPELPVALIDLTLLLARLMWRESGAVYSIVYLSDLLKKAMPTNDSIVTVLRCMAKDEMLHVRYLRVVLAQLANLCDGVAADNPVVRIAHLAAREIASESTRSRQILSSLLKEHALGVGGGMQ